MGVLFMAHRHLSFILVKKRRVNLFKRMWLSLTHISLSLPFDRQQIHGTAGKQHTYVFIYLHKTKASSNGWRRQRNDAQPFNIFHANTIPTLHERSVWRKKKTAVNRMSCFSCEKWWKSLFASAFSLFLLSIGFVAVHAYAAHISLKQFTRILLWTILFACFKSLNHTHNKNDTISVLFLIFVRMYACTMYKHMLLALQRTKDTLRMHTCITVSQLTFQISCFLAYFLHENVQMR